MLWILNNLIWTDEVYTKKRNKRADNEYPANDREVQEFKMPAMLCFIHIDYTKTFDCLKWMQLFKVLRNMKLSSQIVDLVKSNNYIAVRINRKKSEIFYAGFQHLRQMHYARGSKILEWWFISWCVKK